MQVAVILQHRQTLGNTGDGKPQMGTDQPGAEVNQPKMLTNPREAMEALAAKNKDGESEASFSSSTKREKKIKSGRLQTKPHQW